MRHVLPEQSEQQCVYPDLAKHQNEHLTFLADVKQIYQKFEEGKASPIELVEFLKRWLLNHIAVSDKKYAPFFSKL